MTERATAMKILNLNVASARCKVSSVQRGGSCASLCCGETMKLNLVTSAYPEVKQKVEHGGKMLVMIHDCTESPTTLDC